MADNSEGETLKLEFTADQLSLLEQVAVTRGCSVAEFILVESLAEAKRMSGPSERDE